MLIILTEISVRGPIKDQDYIDLWIFIKNSRNKVFP